MKFNQTVVVILAISSIITGCAKNNLLPERDLTIDPTSDLLSGKMPPSDFLIPENFVEDVTNPYFPLDEGDTLFYSATIGEDGEFTTETSYVAITEEDKIIEGIECVVVHDVVFLDGELKEDTYDWYAQDIYGNVWYLGEDTKSYNEDGTYSTEGSFEHGIDGAQGGLIMLGDPVTHFGKGYKQEDYPGFAEDRGKVVGLNETVTIGLGTFTHCLKTYEVSPLEPGFLNVKYYAPGLGFIYSEKASGGIEFQELTGISD
ncbi:MAG: hypothetical protein ACKVPJ_05530 [Chitinophagales bacterium]